MNYIRKPELILLVSLTKEQITKGENLKINLNEVGGGCVKYPNPSASRFDNENGATYCFHVYPSDLEYANRFIENGVAEFALFDKFNKYQIANNEDEALGLVKHGAKVKEVFGGSDESVLFSYLYYLPLNKLYWALEYIQNKAVDLRNL